MTELFPIGTEFDFCFSPDEFNIDPMAHVVHYRVIAHSSCQRTPEEAIRLKNGRIFIDRSSIQLEQLEQLGIRDVDPQNCEPGIVPDSITLPAGVQQQLVSEICMDGGQSGTVWFGDVDGV